MENLPDTAQDFCPWFDSKYINTVNKVCDWYKEQKDDEKMMK